ncbi:MAG: AraC family transcriptional regulator [Bacteroidales bacterium]|nr:AraC family transcriptional regulator [Bacteroidales bacterium]
MKTQQTNSPTMVDYLRRVNIVTAYIEGHLSEPIDVQNLANMSGFSVFHFHRIMKAMLGENIGAFIKRRRLEMAAELLRYTDRPIADVSAVVGYDVPSSLTKAFRECYGVSPSDYRNNPTIYIVKEAKINPLMQLKERIEQLNERPIIYVRRYGAYNSIDYDQSWGSLLEYLKEVYAEEIKKDSGFLYKMLCGGEVQYVGIYHNDPKVTDPDKLISDIGMITPVTLSPKGEIGVKNLAGGKYAIYTYKGSYEHLEIAYDTIYGKLIQEKGYVLDERPAFEIYLNDPQEVAPEELLTDIYVPIV